MCGLVGVLSLPGSPYRVDEALLTRMRDTMIHRGPNGGGLWIAPDRTIGLAHRRLSIIDLSSSADQPMSNEDGSIQLVFNGEIYNHAEIRRELVALGGHRWKTDHSDTEVIVHAFEQWGIDCLKRFRGMFALALWDASRRELWLVRDRIGIKPLYYAYHNGRISFASEIKALLADPDQPRAVNEEAFFQCLSFLTTPAPATLFAGISKLPAGTWVRISSDGSRVEQRYWDAWDDVRPLENETDEQLAGRVLEELRTAVKLRKVSDVPVGVFLSGGIDSSTNAVLFSEGESSPVQTFSIGYDADYASYPSELPYARKVASLVHANHHERLLGADDLLKFLPEMVRLQDEPIGDPVCVPVYFVSQLARQNGVVVCQVGEGADELFCGYASWKRMLNLARWNDLPVPRAAKRLSLAGLQAAGRQQTIYYEWLRRASQGQPVFWGGAEYFSQAEKMLLLSPRLRQQFHDLTSWQALEPIHARFRAKAWDQSHLNWMTYLDLNYRLPELLLMRVDKMSMGVSIECRVPFLDHKFVELALSIPTAVKTRGGELKYLLKKAVRGVIPDEIIDRKKQGFGVPVAEWILGTLGDVIRREVREFAQATDLLDPVTVDAWLVRHPDDSRAWHLLNVALWWKEYVR